MIGNLVRKESKRELFSSNVNDLLSNLIKSLV